MRVVMVLQCALSSRRTFERHQLSLECLVITLVIHHYGIKDISHLAPLAASLKQENKSSLKCSLFYKHLE